MKRPFIHLTTSIMLISTVAPGCSSQKNTSPLPSITQQEKQALRAPVNCATAKRDIKVLQEERASVSRQVLSGARAVMPISAVAGLLMGDYDERVTVATGQYNDDIDTKISQIKRTCRGIG